MSTATILQALNGRNLVSKINGPWHKMSMYLFTFFVVSHWAEHLFQAFQVYVLGWPLSKALGALGMLYPALVSSEWLHYLYAIFMLAGFFLLKPAFVGRGRAAWNVALWIQIWHHFEHALLLGQALSGHNLFGRPMPTSLIQLVMPRMELHLVYNVLVTIPMVTAAFYHVCPPADEPAAACGCARHRKRAETEQLAVVMR